MNSREDILQDLFMNDPRNFHYEEVTPIQKLESVGRRLKVCLAYNAGLH
jgi:hypothetical protein